MDNILIKPVYCKNCNYFFFPTQYKFRGFCGGECYYSYNSKLLFCESSITDKKISVKIEENNSNEF